MSVAALSQLTEWSAVRDSLAEIAASHEDVGRFCSDLFNQLDGLWTELIRRQKAWHVEQQRIESELRQRTAEVERQRVALEAERERVRQEMQAEGRQPAAASSAENEQLLRVLEEVERERAALRDAMQAAQAQMSQLSQATLEFAEARKAIGEERERLATLKSEPAQASADPQITQQISQLEQERSTLEQERVVLETELEAVRSRAAEMSETLSQQGRQMAEERAQWSEELKRMRRLLEELAKRPAAAPAAEEPVAASTPNEGRTSGGKAAPAGSNGDPVLSSVMAQFEMLQKDLTRRRKVAAKSG